MTEPPSRRAFLELSAGAAALAPATQAWIRATRYPTDERVCWMPAGRHNRTAVLPLG
jgi:hypothetical protein